MTCFLLLIVAGWVGCHIELSDATGSTDPGAAGVRDDGWRRTSDGWERWNRWHAGVEASTPWRPPSLHPLRLAIWQVVLSLLALIAFDRALWGRYEPRSEYVPPTKYPASL